MKKNYSIIALKEAIKIINKGGKLQNLNVKTKAGSTFRFWLPINKKKASAQEPVED